MKKFMLFVAALFCSSMMLFAQDSRVVVSDCNFTTPKGFRNLFEWNDEWNTTKQYNVFESLKTETGAVYYIPSTMIKLEVKNGEDWNDVSISSGYKLKEDTKYRLEMQLRIDGTEYRLPDSEADLYVYLDGQRLEVLGAPVNTYPNYSFVWVLSEEFSVYSDEDAGKIGDFRYSVNREKKTAMVMAAWDGEGDEVYYEGNLTIPNDFVYNSVSYTVTSIFDGAFAGCTKPLTLTIPATVTEIIGSAFAGATGLTKIDCKNPAPPTMIDEAFYALDMNKITLVIPSGSEAAYKAAPGWNLFWIKTIYLNAGIWDNMDPVYFVHAWGGTSPAADVKMTSAGDGLYKAEIPSDHDKALFVRMESSATEIKYKKSEGMWDRTCDLDVPAVGHDCYLITGWNNGECPDTYEGTSDKFSGGGWIDHDAVFYVTGDSAFVKDAMNLSKEKAWTPDAIKVTSKHFWRNLKAGQEYKMKVTNGTWVNPKGIIQVKNKMELPGLKGDAEENICFRISKDNTQLDIYLEDDGTITLAGLFEEGPKYYEGYYLMEEPYDVDNDQLAYFVENTEAPGEWMSGIGKADDLKAGTKVLMVEIKNDAIVNWYPSTKNPYTIPAEFAQKEIMVYFRPAGKEEWKALHEGGFFWIEAESATGLENKMTNDKCQMTNKFVKDGQLFILREGKTYTVTGQMVNE